MDENEQKDQAQTDSTQLHRGRTVLVQADTPLGPVRASGTVVDVGFHSFRIKCTAPAPQDDLQPGQEVTISLTDKRGVLPVTTGFIRVLKEDPRVMVLRLPSSSWRQNRRKFFRADAEYPVTIIRSDRSRVVGKTGNISGNGALIRVSVELEIGEEFTMAMEIDKKESLGFKAQVVWGKFDEKRNRGYYGVKFLDISSRDQNKICRLVLVSEFEKRRSEVKDLTERSIY